MLLTDEYAMRKDTHAFKFTHNHALICFPKLKPISLPQKLISTMADRKVAEICPIMIIGNEYERVIIKAKIIIKLLSIAKFRYRADLP